MKDVHVMAFLAVGFPLLIMGAITWVIGDSGANTVFPEMGRIGVGIFSSGMILLGTGTGLSFAIKPVNDRTPSPSKT